MEIDELKRLLAQCQGKWRLDDQGHLYRGRTRVARFDEPTVGVVVAAVLSEGLRFVNQLIIAQRRLAAQEELTEGLMQTHPDYMKSPHMHGKKF